MKIIFLGTTGVHHTLIAANLYLDNMEPKDYVMIDGFDDSAKDFSGFPIYIKDDNKGNQVYTLGVGKEVLMVKKTLEHLIHILDINKDELIVRPVSIKGEKRLYLLNKITSFLKFSFFSPYIAKYLVNKEYKAIEKNVLEFIEKLNQKVENF